MKLAIVLGVEPRSKSVLFCVRDEHEVDRFRLELTPGEAREIGEDLMRRALELEDGGSSAERIGGWAAPQS